MNADNNNNNSTTTTTPYNKEEPTSTFTPINTKPNSSPTMEPKKATPKSTSTPQKRAHNNAHQTQHDKDQNQDQDQENTPSTPTKKSRTIPTKAIVAKANALSPTKKALGPIPATIEAASSTDKAILRMRDDEGLGWKEITAEWTKLVGVTTPVGQSTLRMRYTTMKANFAGFSADDELRLLKHKKQIEQRFETEKWSRIADAIVADGGAKYPVASLQKKFKQLARAEAGSSASASASADAEDE